MSSELVTKSVYAAGVFTVVTLLSGSARLVGRGRSADGDAAVANCWLIRPWSWCRARGRHCVQREMLAGIPEAAVEQATLVGAPHCGDS